MNCSQVSHTNHHCSLAKDLIDVDSVILITSVVGSGFETASERSSTQQFLAAYCDVKYFPENFADFFPNLEFISIIHAKMKEIRQGDLKQFPNLIELDLSSNAISKIERNLFKFNEKLKEIRMVDNPIFTIHPEAFVGLKNLERLKLGKVNFEWTATVAEYRVMEANVKDFYGLFIILLCSSQLLLIILSIVIYVKLKRARKKLNDTKKAQNMNGYSFEYSQSDQETLNRHSNQINHEYTEISNLSPSIKEENDAKNTQNDQKSHGASCSSGNTLDFRLRRLEDDQKSSSNSKLLPIYSQVTKRDKKNENFYSDAQNDQNYSSPFDDLSEEVVYAEPDEQIHIYDDVYESKVQYENITTASRRAFGKPGE